MSIFGRPPQMARKALEIHQAVKICEVLCLIYRCDYDFKNIRLVKDVISYIETKIDFLSNQLDRHQDVWSKLVEERDSIWENLKDLLLGKDHLSEIVSLPEEKKQQALLILTTFGKDAKEFDSSELDSTKNRLSEIKCEIIKYRSQLYNR